jgi:Tol biopolymer transport system component
MMKFGVLSGTRLRLVTATFIAATCFGGTEANASNVSADGLLVVFSSASSNLVKGDGGRHTDVFIRNRATKRTRRVSVSLSGGPRSGSSVMPSISADGRFVAFHSSARNLVPDDDNNANDVFVRDLETGETQRVSVSTDGDEANGPSFSTSISGDGRLVAFQSLASNLVEEDTTVLQDIFVHDRLTGETRRISVSSSGTQGNAGSVGFDISADGSRLAFWSAASNLVNGDTNGADDVFVHDLDAGTTSRVSVGATGAQGNGRSIDPSISADGRFVAFASTASNLVTGDRNRAQDVFVRDLALGTTRRVSRRLNGGHANDHSGSPSISADGRQIAFQSSATNLVRADTNRRLDVFLRNMRTGNTRRISVSSNRREGNGHSGLLGPPAVHGRTVVFDSSASNLVKDDTNRSVDVFARSLRTGKTRRLSVSSAGAQGNSDSCLHSCVP